jgi:hypothetical protein
MSGKPMDDNDIVRLHGHAAYDPVGHAEPFSPEQAEPEGSVAGPPGDWPEPQPLAESLPPVAAFEMDLLPPPFRPWIADVVHRLQAPMDFVAIGAVVAIASVIGRGVALRPKQRDDWTVVSNLWGGVVAEPGMYKSPSLKAALAFLNRLAAEAMQAHERALQDMADRELVNDAEVKALKKRIKNAVETRSGRGPGRLRIVRDGETPEPAPETEEPSALAAQLTRLQQSAKAPGLRRYIVNDPSVEKLGELLEINERGLLLFRDELTGFLYKLESDGHESDRAFYLEAWDGNGQPFTYDRIQRGTIRIEAPCVSILGGVQPRPLAAYVRSTWKGGAGDDGFIQRFQLLVWPDPPKDCRYIDEWPDNEAKDRVYTIFRDASQPGLAARIGASPDTDGTGGIPFLRFSPEAQPLFDAWYQELQLKIRAGDEHPAMRSHLAKYASLMPSLALVFHAVAVMDGSAVAGPVTAEAAALAIRWTNYLETHARRIYAAIMQRRQMAGALLGAKVKAGKLADGFTLREVYLKGWAGLTDNEDMKLALEELVELGWLRPQQVLSDPVQGGRPTIRYYINPRLHDA